jgi:peptidoglycan/xylan/chitin deacetylase (PgdA/CDA1 family)
MKITQRNRYIGLLFAAGTVLAVGGPYILLQTRAATTSSYQVPEPLPLNFTSAQQTIINECKSNVSPAQPTEATQPRGMEVPVILYHRVTEEDKPSHEVIRPLLFRQDMDVLKADGYTTVSIAQLTDYMNGKGTMPAKPVVITFDDGWKSSLDAAEYLKRINFGATFFIITGFFDAPRYVDKKELLKLAENPKFEIGSHTHTHFIKNERDLSKLDLCTMAREIVGSKGELETLLQKPVTAFAWPYGYNTVQAIQIAKDAGYTSTMLVNRDANNAPGNSPYFTRRMNIDGNCSLEDFHKMVDTRVLKECS